MSSTMLVNRSGARIADDAIDAFADAVSGEVIGGFPFQAQRH
jgi:hypothetical protein